MTPEEIARLPYRQNVGVMLVNAAGLAFVGQRIDAPVDNPAWQMPQGGIDKGESPRDAALRELQEETGVAPNLVSIEAETRDWITYDLPLEMIPHLWKGRYRGQEQKWFLMRFHGTDDQIQLDADEHREFSAWKWSPADDVIAEIVPFKRHVYRQVVAAFRDRL